MEWPLLSESKAAQGVNHWYAYNSEGYFEFMDQP